MALEALGRHGVTQSLEEALKELALNAPEPLGLAPSSARGGETGRLGGLGAAMRSAAAARFVAERLAERAGLRTSVGRAVQLVRGCDPRTSVRLMDNVAEAFLALAQESEAASEAAGEVDSAALKPHAMNGFLDRLNSDLPDPVQRMLRPLVTVPEKASDGADGAALRVYLVSFNDFCCAVIPCLAMRELVRCARELFHELDADEDGLVSLADATDALGKLDWARAADIRCSTRGEPPKSDRAAARWQSSAQRVVAPLPAPAVPQASNEELVRRASGTLQREAIALDDPKRFGRGVHGCRKAVPESLFVHVVATSLSPLGQCASTWMA